VAAPAAIREPERPPLLLTMPILERMRQIEGWLDDAEADLLIAGLARAVAAVPEAHAIVEVGSYCGRSTIALGAALSALPRSESARIYAIDPHEGVVGAVDQGITRNAPTLEKFRRNIAAAGLTDLIEPIVKSSFEVDWQQPICFLLIDGLHDYANVARDFYQFERWIAAGGFVAFHDYANYYPGVKTLVDELLAVGGYERAHLAGSMMLLRKREPAGTAVSAPLQERLGAPAVIVSEPLVSCIMATADRAAFIPHAIRYFERQDYTNRELIVIDDGAEPIESLIPKDERIRYIPLPARRTMGAKHNLACKEARGEIILHWDDDDWMSPWRISYQVAQIRPEPLDTLSGLSHLLFWDPRARHAWEYVYPPGDRPWVAGGTFCYRREFWESRQFPDMNEGADTVFVWGLQNARVQALAEHGFYVALIHQNNTSRKRTNTFGWRPLAVNTVEKLMADDLAFYGSLQG
jgi:predicted O-methyltransferase YrrM